LSESKSESSIGDPTFIKSNPVKFQKKHLEIVIPINEEADEFEVFETSHEKSTTTPSCQAQKPLEGAGVPKVILSACSHRSSTKSAKSFLEVSWRN